MTVSLKQQVLGGLAAVSLLFAGSTAAGIWITVQGSEAVELSDASAQGLVAHMQADMMHDALRGDVLSGFLVNDPVFELTPDTVRSQVIEHSKSLQQSLITGRNFARGAEMQAILDKVDIPAQEYIDMVGKIVDAADINPNGAKSMMKEFVAKFEAMESAMAQATSALLEEENQNREAAADLGDSGRNFLLGILLLGLLLCGILAWLALKQILQPLMQISNVTNKLVLGDLTTEVPAVARDNEIGELFKAIGVFKNQAVQNKRSGEAAAQVIKALGKALESLAEGDLTYRISEPFPDELDQLRGYFNAAADSLAETIGNVKHGSDGILSGTEEIAKASDDLSRRTENQAANLEETAAAVAEITSAVKKTASGANHARGMVTAAKEEADKSGEVVRRAVEAMRGIEKSSQKITQIIGVIDEIAFQTNLLALNAGVEAARAGDAGRGFAVVASEVRALAHRSAEAAKEIKSLLSTSASQVEDGVQLVAETGTSLKHIIDRVAEINGIVAEIASSAEQQASGLQEVNTAVDQMDQVTQQNAAMVEEATAATRTLTQQSSELARLVSRFTIVARTAISHAIENVKHKPAPRAPSMPSQVKRRAAASSQQGAGSAGWEEF